MTPPDNDLPPGAGNDEEQHQRDVGAALFLGMVVLALLLIGYIYIRS